MDEDTRSTLRFVGAHLVFVVGLLHLALGVLNWLRWLLAGFVVPRDARWPVFVLSGLAVLAGLFLAGRATDRRPYYAEGIVVMLGYAVGYFAWHLGGHRRLLVVGPAPVAETVTIQWFIDHLFAGPVETLAIVAEVLAAATLLALLVTD